MEMDLSKLFKIIILAKEKISWITCLFFNKDYAKKFSKYITGKTIVIGSFKNNHKKIIKRKKK